MIHSYQPLSLHRLEPGAGYFQPQQQPLEYVTLDHPAVAAMTDLSQTSAFVTELSTPLVMARNIMMRRGIRLLLVCNDDDHVIGLITSHDLEGDKSQRILAKARLTWDDLIVADVMTLRLKVEVLRMQDVSKARIGDIVATLRQVNRQHALVIDSDPKTGKPAVRGIFSLSQIGLQLGLNIAPAHPTTYAEWESVGGVLL
jgi:signal-transduction protein with cAMP-binding, CBS, and nucleotidyltransferase domain